MRIGIIGCGEAVVRGHVRLLQTYDPIEVSAIADVTLEQRTIVGDALNVAPQRRYADYSDLLDQVDVDAVLIATPPGVRPMIIEDALAHGVHVVSEKPIATTLSAAEAVLRDGASASITMCHNYAFFDEFSTAEQLVRDDAIGRVHTILLQGLGANAWPGVKGYRPGWRDEIALGGGGRFMDTGIHAVYLMEMLMGRSAVAVAAHVVPDGNGGDAQCFARYQFDDGVALVNIGRGNGGAAVSIVGSRGRIHFDYDATVGDMATPPRALVVVRDGQAAMTIPVETRGMYTRSFYDEIVRRVATRPDICEHTGRHGRRSLELVLGAYAAASAGRAQALPISPSDPVYSSGVAVCEFDA